jgi:phosphoribosyl 1,2-cyclic phosphodiesterase
MESPFFPVGLREVPANVRIEELKEMSFHVGAVRVQAYYANHPGICVGYRLFTSEGSVAFFPDFEPYHSHRHLNHHHNSGDTTHTHADYAQQAEQKVIEFLRGTDVLIMDAQYDRQEYGQHVGWGHACLDDVVALALKAEVKQLYLFHHDPGHDDAKISAMVAEARQQVAAQKGTLQIEAAQKGTLQIEAAREGTAVELAAVAAARR